jgi:hypothetical protein
MKLIGLKADSQKKQRHITPYSRCRALTPWFARGISRKLGQADNLCEPNRIAVGTTCLKVLGSVNMKTLGEISCK